MPRKIVLSPQQLKELYEDRSLFTSFLEVFASQSDITVLQAMTTARYALKQYSIMFPDGISDITCHIDEETGEFTAAVPTDYEPPKQQRAKPKNEGVAS